MAHNFSLRARKLAWSFSDEKDLEGITQIRRVGTDSTLNDSDDEDTEAAPAIPPSIQRIDASADINTFASALRKDGCVIIENFTDVETLQRASEEAKPLLQSSNNPTPLIKQSPTIRNNLLANNTYQQLCNEFLAVETTKWKNDDYVTEKCQPILSSAHVRKLHRVAFDSNLSRYDSALGIKHEKVGKYEPGRDSMLGLLVPSSGTVRFYAAPRSHLNGKESFDFLKDTVEEKVKAGDAIITLGSLYHYVVAQVDRQQSHAEAPSVYALWSCAGIYRPEEQAALIISAAEVKTYPEVVQERLR